MFLASYNIGKISSDEAVSEIGPGKGIITEQLVLYAVNKLLQYRRSPYLKTLLLVKFAD